MVEEFILPVRLNTLAGFWDMDDWNFMISVGVANIRLTEMVKNMAKNKK